MGANCLDQARLTKVSDALTSQIAESLKRGQERGQKRDDEDYDEELEEELKVAQGDDEYTLQQLGDAIQAIFKAHKDGYLPHFDAMLHLLSELLVCPPLIFSLLYLSFPFGTDLLFFFAVFFLKAPTRNTTERQLALLIIDNVIEFTGPISWKYQELLLPQLSSSLTNATPEIRHAAAYGVGVCAQFGGPNYAPFCLQALPHLINIVTTQGAREDENISATETGPLLCKDKLEKRV